MKATIRDKETLGALGPSEATAYLRSQGWQHTETIGDKGSAWTLQGIDEAYYEILLPMRQDLRDYVYRIAELLETLEVVEERSQLEIYRDIVQTGTDTVRLRFQSPLFKDGSMPLEQGVRILEQARDLMLAAACAATQRRPVYPRKPAQALAFLEKVRLGQTERGSFVIALQTPVPPRLFLPSMSGEAENTSLEIIREDDEPFERRVTLVLADSLRTVQRAISEAHATGNMGAFQEAVASGVSANLCEALVGIGETTALQELILHIHWAAVRPVLENPVEQVTFSADAFPVLREAARLLRKMRHSGFLDRKAS